MIIIPAWPTQVRPKDGWHVGNVNRNSFEPEIPGIELCSPLWRIQTELEATLKDNEEGFAGIALCAFKGAQIETRFVRLDAGQPHRFAASGAVQNSDLRNAKKWIGLGG